MPLVRHRFGDFCPEETQIIILGTFNPDVPCNPARFFYSRPQNHFWRLLPEVFGHPSLKKAHPDEKKSFARAFKIGFVDLIEAVDVPTGLECDYRDTYLDDKVSHWNDVIFKLKNQYKVTKILFTRKSFSGIPNILDKLKNIEEFCRKAGIHFSLLPTPARIYTAEKSRQWKHLFNEPSPDPYRATGTLQDSPMQRYK